jgi:putative flavoprotein involved in K+ transport
MPEVIDFIDTYAKVISAPVETNTTVTSVRRTDPGYVVSTDQGEWHCHTVVLASGACNVPRIPAIASAVPENITTLSSMDYRNPDQLEDGGVLVVGASATGTQLADEIHRSGRPVTMSVGEHIRAPRIYRGKDIEWWMDVAGVHDERYDEVDDIRRARSVPSLQLTGTDSRRTLDLNALTEIGVNLIGRLAGINGGKAQFSGSLRNQCKLSDLKMGRLLDSIDEWAGDNSYDGQVEAPHRLPPTVVEDAPPLGMDLMDGKIKTVLWATGYSPDFSWLDVPVFDRKGRIKHDGGVVESPGLYMMGMQFLRKRKSALIDGAGDDARDLSAHLAGHLDGAVAAAAQ